MTFTVSRQEPKRVDGKVELSLLVDALGRPRNIMFLHPLGTDLDKFALQTVAADRFAPGEKDGTPVAVAQSVEVDIQACTEQTKGDRGQKTLLLRLRSQPVQKLGALPHPPEDAVLASDDVFRKEYSSGSPLINQVGGKVTAPIPLNSVKAEFTDAARKAKYQGACLISVIVDKNGMPRNPRVVRTLDYGLEQNAIEAIERYRFKPAMRDGEPIPVMISVEVNFQIY